MAKKLKVTVTSPKTPYELFLEEKEREHRIFYYVKDTALCLVAVGEAKEWRLDEYNKTEPWNGHKVIRKDRLCMTVYETAQQAVYAKVQENNTEIKRLNQENEYVMEHLKHN